MPKCCGDCVYWGGAVESGLSLVSGVLNIFDSIWGDGKNQVSDMDKRACQITSKLKKRNSIAVFCKYFDYK